MKPLEPSPMPLSALPLARIDGVVTDRRIDPDALAFVNHLRFVAMACRAKRRTSLFEACSLLHVDGARSRDAHADALMRCIEEALSTRVRLHAPGTAELTFDEAWLGRLGQACARGDVASSEFLLRSRVPRQHRRLLRFLVDRISERFFQA